MFCVGCIVFFFFKQKTAYEMRISDWISDVCSSDLPGEIWHHDNIVDWTAQLLIAHSGEILLGTNAAAFGILKVSHRRDIHQAPKAETVDAVSRLHTGTGFAFACGPAVEQSFEILAPLSKVCRQMMFFTEIGRAHV